MVIGSRGVHCELTSWSHFHTSDRSVILGPVTAVHLFSSTSSVFIFFLLTKGNMKTNDSAPLREIMLDTRYLHPVIYLTCSKLRRFRQYENSQEHYELLLLRRLDTTLRWKIEVDWKGCRPNVLNCPCCTLKLIESVRDACLTFGPFKLHGKGCMKSWPKLNVPCRLKMASRLCYFIALSYWAVVN